MSAARERFDRAEIALGQALAEHHHAHLALVEAVVRAERERCAQVAESHGWPVVNGPPERIADAIRRGLDQVPR